MTTLSDFDPAEYLENKEAFEVFMDETFKIGDAGFIAKSLGIVARGICSIPATGTVFLAKIPGKYL